MSDGTKIEWTDATWNPITGCSVVSAGCKHCYAMKLAGTRLQHHPSRAGLTHDTKNGPVWTGEVRFNEQWLDQPLRWKRPRMVFVCAHADLFHESVPDEWIDNVFAVMALAPQHTFQVLTKRADRMRDYMNDSARVEAIRKVADGDIDEREVCRTWPLPNVWLGVSVENQAAADERIPLLLDTPAAVRWISAEPLLGPVDLSRIQYEVIGPSGSVHYRRPLTDTKLLNEAKATPGYSAASLDWVVVGGESGPKARPMHPQWARDLRDQCAAAGVPFLFKQWGEWVPRSSCYHTFEDGRACADIDPSATEWPCIRMNENGGDGHRLEDEDGGDSAYMQRVGKKSAGRLLDGVQHDGYPGGAE